MPDIAPGGQPQEAGCGSPLEWRGSYSGQWALLSEDSVAHPAKMAPGLCYRILGHLEELGLLKPDDVVLDPLAGTGMSGLCWAAKGGRAILVELEPKFVAFCEDNKGHLEKTLGHPVDITILQGDARKLSQLLRERGLIVVSSPPYQDSVIRPGGTNWGPENQDWRNFRDWKRDKGYGSTPGQIGELPDRAIIGLTSPPYAETESRDRSKEGSWATEAEHPRGDLNISQGCGDTKGQIARLPDLALKAVLSPPYGDSEVVKGNAKHSSIEDKKARRAKDDWQGYGSTPGQIGELPDRPLKAITSPPYGNQELKVAENSTLKPATDGSSNTEVSEEAPSYLNQMKIVYAELAKICDVLAIVTKNPTRAGKLRRLDLDTIALLEATGWRVVCHHHALLFEEVEQGDLTGGSQKRVKGRLSFFKRLSYQRGSPVAHWEDCLFAVKLDQAR